MDLSALAVPVIQAPMAGGPSTPRLAAAVSEAGGLGFLAGGYLSADRLRADLEETARLSAAPVGVNLFVPSAQVADADDVARYEARLAVTALRWGIEPGRAKADDDGWAEKLALLLAHPVPVVSFTFGLPETGVIEALQQAGSTVLVTVTRVEEAVAAASAGVDALVVQGVEAGGHRGGFVDDGTDDLGILVLLRAVATRTDLPLIAAGGVADGASLAAVLVAGAVAAQLGTAFLRCPEAGTSPVHRQALAATGPTVLTRAFTGRTARGIDNRFHHEHGEFAPAAYPQVHHLTAPLRAAARERGDQEWVNLWAGQGYSLARERPAAEIVTGFLAQADEALAQLMARRQ